MGNAAMTRWFSVTFWKYLLEPKDDETSWFKVIRCRAKGHPFGVVWFNSYGLEPDMHCKNCNDDLG